MKSTRTLPESNQPARTFSLKSTGTLLGLNVIGIFLLILSGWGFVRLFAWLRPGDTIRAFSYSAARPSQLVTGLAMILLVTGLMLVVHEGIHGLFFWLFTRSRPIFAFKGYYASAAAPGWYIPRNPYLLIGLAPLVLMTLLGVLLLPFIPVWMFLPLLVLVAMNVSGAVGDLWMTLSLLAYPSDSLAFDQGDEMTLFVRKASPGDAEHSLPQVS
jgi:hypothetical protein